MKHLKINNAIVKFGNWIFSFRNFLFPILYLFLFIPSENLLKNSQLAVITGLLLIIFGSAIRIATIGLEYIKRGGLKRKIYAEKLVTGGIYGICRNPMYLGNLFILSGFGIYANSALFTFIILPLYIFIYLAIIKAEEQFLTEKFGDEFIRYKKKVHPLIPSLRKFRGLFKNQKFNWEKVIFKEYNALFLYISSLLIIAFYQNKIGTILFIISLTFSLLIYLSIKIKKYINKKNTTNQL